MKLSITSEAELSDDLSRFLSSETQLSENSNITAIYQAKFVKENDGLSLSFLYYNISSSLYYAVSFPCCNDKITLSSLYPLIDSFFHFPVEKGSLLLLEDSVLLMDCKEYFSQIIPYLLKIAQENYIPVLVT